jgi:hypothetical protein
MEEDHEMAATRMHRARRAVEFRFRNKSLFNAILKRAVATKAAARFFV